MDLEPASHPPPDGTGNIMTVAIYHPPPISFLSNEICVLGSRIQDDEVSSTIGPEENNSPTSSNLLAITAAGECDDNDDDFMALKEESRNDRKMELLKPAAILPSHDSWKVKVEEAADKKVKPDTSAVIVYARKSAPAEYSPAEESPSTSQPSPPEAPVVESESEEEEEEDFFELTSVPFPGLEIVSELPPIPEQSQNSGANKYVDQPPKVVSDKIPQSSKVQRSEEEKKSNEDEADVIAGKEKDAASAIPKGKNESHSVADLLSSVYKRNCRLVVKKCDATGNEGLPSGWRRHTGNKFIFYGKMTEEEIERAMKFRRTAARIKQEPLPKQEIKVERRGRPKKVKMETGSTPKVKTETPNTSPMTGLRRRRKRRGMTGSVPYSRYNKNMKKLKSLRSIKTESETNNDDLAKRSQEDIAVLEEELSMMDTCPSPYISDSDNESTTGNEDDLESPINIITAEEARRVVTAAWVNMGESETESPKLFPTTSSCNNSNPSQKISSKSKQVTEPLSTTPDCFGENNDEEDEEDGVVTEEEETEVKPATLLKCSTCSKTFDNPLTLQVHMRLHTGEKPYKCKRCQEAFIHYTYLEYHYKNTHGIGESKSPTKTKSAQSSPDKRMGGRTRSSSRKGLTATSSTRNCRIALFPPKPVEEMPKPIPPKPVEEMSKPKRSPVKRASTTAASTPRTIKKTKMRHPKPAPVLQVTSYICPFCKLAFQHASLLITHLKRHSGDHPFKCLQCDQGFRQSRQLDKHMKRSHSNKPDETKAVASPEVSNQLENIPEESEEQQAKHHHQNKIATPVPKSNLSMRRPSLRKSSGPKKQVRIADQEIRPDQNYTNGGGDTKADDSEDDDLFVKIRRYRCRHCGKKFLSSDGLKAHGRTHTNERPFKCSHCPMGFIQKVHMEKHVRLIHTQWQSKKYKCTECNGGFRSEGNLKIHLEKAHGRSSTAISKSYKIKTQVKLESKPISVSISNKNASQRQPQPSQPATKINFLQQKRRRKTKSVYFTSRYRYNPSSSNKQISGTLPTPTANDEPQQDIFRAYVSLVRCDYLIKKWKGRKGEGQQHSRAFKPEPQSQTVIRTSANEPIPGKVKPKKIIKTSSKSTSKLFTADNKKRPYKCPTCAKGYTTKFILEEHERTHSGIKPHECKHCGKRFARLSGWYNHCRTHRSEPSHKCSVCSKAFPQEQTLKLHMRAHEEDEI